MDSEKPVWLLCRTVITYNSTTGEKELHEHPEIIYSSEVDGLKIMDSLNRRTKDKPYILQRMYIVHPRKTK